jgi:hypothetical protein
VEIIIFKFMKESFWNINFSGVFKYSTSSNKIKPIWSFSSYSHLIFLLPLPSGDTTDCSGAGFKRPRQVFEKEKDGMICAASFVKLVFEERLADRINGLLQRSGAWPINKGCGTLTWTAHLGPKRNYKGLPPGQNQ